MIEVRCLQANCGKSFNTKDKRRKYCSRSCAAIENNRSKIKHGLYSRNHVKYCVVCSNIIGRLSKLFCSHNCQTEFSRNKKILQWKLGDSSVASQNSGKLRHWAKEVLVSFADSKCSQCGWNTPNKSLGRPILAIDHIDGDRYNNRFDNLRVLCYNCHTLTETFGTLNGIDKYKIDDPL